MKAGGRVEVVPSYWLGLVTSALDYGLGGSGRGLESSHTTR